MFETAKQWEVQAVGGRFPLLQYLGGSPDAAIFLTEWHDGDRTLSAAIKFIASSSENASPENPTPENPVSENPVSEKDEAQLSRWRLAAGLSHPNLIPLFDSGRCEIDNVQLLYVVTEHAPENLAEVVSERALTPDEARAMLDPVADVLAYLHGLNLVHGDLRPANILAREDHLWVSSDTICRVGEQLGSSVGSTVGSGVGSGLGSLPYSPPENRRGIISAPATASASADIWSLGITLIEALTRTLPETTSAPQESSAIPTSLPQPFLDIVRHCLVPHPQGRWTIREVAARLQGQIAPDPPAPSRPAAASLPARAKNPKQQPHALAAAAATSVAVFAVLIGVLVSPRVFNRKSSSQIPTVDLEQTASDPQEQSPPLAVPPAPSASSKTAPPLVAAAPSASSRSSSSHSSNDRPSNDRPRSAAPPPSANPSSSGEIIRQVLPIVSDGARRTIHGTIRVSVRAHVDASGSVTSAELASPVPSKYFAAQALKAAQQWTFKPDAARTAAGATWLLRFEFTQDDTHAGAALQSR